MKNAVFLVSVWVGIIIAAYAMVYWDLGTEQPAPIAVLEPTGSTYVEPDGRFSLAVPSAWDLEETEAGVLLTDPSGEIEVTIFSVDQPIPETALLLALGILHGEPSSEGVTVEEITPPSATERAVRIAAPPDGSKISYGLAYLYEGETTILLVRGDETALADHAADLDRIEIGIAVPATAGSEATPVEEPTPVVEM